MLDIAYRNQNMSVGRLYVSNGFIDVPLLLNYYAEMLDRHSFFCT